MDPLTSLYEKLRQQAALVANKNRLPGQMRSLDHLPEEPPLLEDWLRYWNDEDTDLGNLRNFEHWISRARSSR